MTATIVLALRIAMAIALYVFLGWALLTLWQELRQQANNLARQKHPRLGITFRTGQDQLIQNWYTETEITIGRDRNCHLPVTDEAVSAHHARITFHHGQWWLEDLESTNGTYLNNEKLYVPTVLMTGDEFKCGDTLFGVRIESETSDKISPTKRLDTGGPP
ncbi:MAG: FHA domain-containing protein [Chloroflexi bacterium]|nr:FHA domain-containing protein [Chloroflexota bacterium]